MSQYLNQGKVRTLEAVQLHNWVIIMLDQRCPVGRVVISTAGSWRYLNKILLKTPIVTR